MQNKSTAINQALLESAMLPLSPEQAAQVARSALALIIYILSKKSIDAAMAKVMDNTEAAKLLAGLRPGLNHEQMLLGHLAMMFPNMSPTDKILLMTLTEADL